MESRVSKAVPHGLQQRQYNSRVLPELQAWSPG